MPRNDAELEVAPRVGPIRHRSAVGSVARELLDLVTRGAILPGDKLPSERHLAAAFGVGRSAVREAMAALEMLGVVRTRPGSGSYVRDSAVGPLPETLSWTYLLSRQSAQELIEIRGELESVAAARAVADLTEANLRVLQSHVDVMRSSADHSVVLQADAAFHALIAKSCGNSALAELLQQLRALLRVWVQCAVHNDVETGRAAAEHQAVLDAVASGDPARADHAMRLHMATVRGRLLSISASPAEPAKEQAAADDTDPGSSGMTSVST